MSRSDRLEPAERLLIALAFAFTTAALGYAALRALDVFLFPTPNPALILWSERSGFLWRSAIALYIGGMGAFAGYALAARSPEAAARWLARAVALAALAVLAQSAVLP